ncbi:hypothetical protein M3212_06145 [Alkalihalobacillus oceani]|uniref:hypothetical protein n=1 Tax=Halalkalibacter oceani TaxID=1653776 RepID=UPI002040BE14|nr:hypothetical protein [Halalkalibacter oceani]MCM3760369.1 hypothetical protein [Halalkalibacter oceani]
MKKTLTEQYENAADAKEQVTIQTDDSLPNKKNIPGDSVEAHKELEKANALITGEEIRQQNENL